MGVPLVVMFNFFWHFFNVSIVEAAAFTQAQSTSATCKKLLFGIIDRIDLYNCNHLILSLTLRHFPSSTSLATSFIILFYVYTIFSGKLACCILCSSLFVTCYSLAILVRPYRPAYLKYLLRCIGKYILY